MPDELTEYRSATAARQEARAAFIQSFPDLFPDVIETQVIAMLTGIDDKKQRQHLADELRKYITKVRDEHEKRLAAATAGYMIPSDSLGDDPASPGFGGSIQSANDEVVGASQSTLPSVLTVSTEGSLVAGMVNLALAGAGAQAHQETDEELAARLQAEWNAPAGGAGRGRGGRT